MNSLTDLLWPRKPCTPLAFPWGFPDLARRGGSPVSEEGIRKQESKNGEVLAREVKLDEFFFFTKRFNPSMQFA